MIIAGAIYKPALIKIAKVGKFKNLINILLHGLADNAKININLQDQLGNTALINALKFKNNDVAILLINNGADINVQNILDKDSALLISVKNHDNDIAKLIINNSKSDLNIKDKWNKTPLMIAARDNLEIVKLLLDSGRVNINSRDGAGRTALMAAISVGNIDIVKLLINKGAEISIKGVDDTTALMLAIKYPQILKLLIDTGKIDINAKNKLKATALSLARKMGFKEAVELLISAGAK